MEKIEFYDVMVKLFGEKVAKDVRQANLNAKEDEFIVPNVTAGQLIDLWNCGVEAGIDGYKFKHGITK